MKLPHALLWSLVLGLGACSKGAESPPHPQASTLPLAAPGTALNTAAVAAHDSIAWRRGDVDAAFAEAKAANKPVFLYWGAGWCPPCNQMKATLFRRRDFIERTQSFVPVYIDGDTPAAQKLGSRFSVSGYPTMVLFRADGTEVTRLPGEADPERYLQVLALGMSARPVHDTLQSALGDGRGLGADDWKMLAWYSWDTDDQQLVPSAQVPATLQALATRCPAAFAGTRTRLMLRSAAAAGSLPSEPQPQQKPRPHPTRGLPFDRPAVLARLEQVLASPQSSRDAFDLLTGALPEMVEATTRPGSPERRHVIGSADRALTGLAADTRLSNTDRLGATLARVQLATLDAKPGDPVVLPDALRETVQRDVARADRESGDAYERQTVIHTAARLLADAGLVDASDALLRAELSRSHSPYYFMLDLAANAKKLGDKAAAITWYAKAYDAAQGPATRLQWGATYIGALVELAPDDAARIVKVATQVLGEVEPVPESFDGRNRTSLARIATRVAGWKDRGGHDTEALQVADASRTLCDRLPAGVPERARCGELLKVDPRPAAPARSGTA